MIGTLLRGGLLALATTLPVLAHDEDTTQTQTGRSPWHMASFAEYGSQDIAFGDGSFTRDADVQLSGFSATLFYGDELKFGPYLGFLTQILTTTTGAQYGGRLYRYGGEVKETQESLGLFGRLYFDTGSLKTLDSSQRRLEYSGLNAALGARRHLKIGGTEGFVEVYANAYTGSGNALYPGVMSSTTDYDGSSLGFAFGYEVTL